MKRLKSTALLTLIFSVTCGAIFANAQPVKDWTVVVFTEARNNLSGFAEKNIRDMLSVGSNDRLNILVQWYKPRSNEAYRYRVDQGKLTPCGVISTSRKGNHKQDLIDSMRWAVKDYPAKHYNLVLWNHGLGIIDPVWTSGQILWGSGASVTTPGIQQEMLEEMQNNPRAQIPGITSAFSSDHRGVLFDEESRTYLNNQDLQAALHSIKHDVLNGKNIDVLGMDACYMAMTEIVDIVSKYADYYVASQEVELAQGWDYYQLLSLATANSLTPAQFAQATVLSFENFFKKRTQLYTLSAIELKGYHYLKKNINEFIDQFHVCKSQDKRLCKTLVKNARRYCLQFSTPSFVDLHSFYYEMRNQMETGGKKKGKSKRRNTPAHCFEKLKKIVEQGMQIIEHLAIAYTGGHHLRRARGLGIYFPKRGCDRSYVQTTFARDTKWYHFIKEYQRFK